MAVHEMGKDRWWALGLGVAALVLYVATLAPTVVTVFDDSLEFQVVLPSLGIAHPTGYPLYTVVGALFTRLLPVGDLAYRTNLLSALCGAAAVGVFFLAARTLGSSRLAAAAAALIFALSPTWWSQATIAEVYALHGLFVALILWLALRGGRGVVVPVALLTGLSLAHHRTTLLLLPGVAVAVVWGAPGLLRRPGQVVAALAAFLAPLLLYLYLPLRGRTVSSLDGTYTNTWQGFWQHVLAQDYGAFLAGNPLGLERPADYGSRLFTAEVTLAGMLLGVLGWVRLLQQPRRLACLALVFGANLVFAVGYRTADVDVFYLPAIMVWLLVAAVGLTAVLDQLAALLAGAGRTLRLPGSYRAWLAVLQVGVLVVVLAGPLLKAVKVLRTEPRPRACLEVLAVGEPPAFSPNRAGDWSASNCGRAMLSLPLPEGSRVVGLLGEATLLRYLQMAEGLRRDVVPVVADREADRLAAVEGELAAGHAVYLTRELAGAAERYTLSAEGPLVRVWPQGEAPAKLPGTTVDVPMGEAVRLVGYELSRVPAEGAAWVRLQLAWQADGAIGEDLKVSARLVGPDGAVVAAQDAVPVHWAYPTTAWRPGEVIGDAYDFVLAEGYPVDELLPQVILYRAADGVEVGRFEPGEGSLEQDSARGETVLQRMRG